MQRPPAPACSPGTVSNRHDSARPISAARQDPAAETKGPSNTQTAAQSGVRPRVHARERAASIDRPHPVAAKRLAAVAGRGAKPRSNCRYSSMSPTADTEAKSATGRLVYSASRRNPLPSAGGGSQGARHPAARPPHHGGSDRQTRADRWALDPSGHRRMMTSAVSSVLPAGGRRSARRASARASGSASPWRARESARRPRPVSMSSCRRSMRPSV